MLKEEITNYSQEDGWKEMERGKSEEEQAEEEADGGHRGRYDGVSSRWNYSWIRKSRGNE